MQDIDALHALWIDPDVRRYLWDDVEIPRERAAETVAGAVASASATGLGMWAVTLRGLPLLIGFCGFRHIDDGPEVELLYGFYPEFWGKGLAAEAALAALEYGFENRLFERIWGRTDAPNRSSVKVLERLGMRFEHETSVNGLPTLCYSLDRSMFQRRGHARSASY